MKHPERLTPAQAVRLIFLLAVAGWVCVGGIVWAVVWLVGCLRG